VGEDRPSDNPGGPYSGPVEDFFYQEIPPEVWHYTKVESFASIVSSGTMWATDARFTNDRTEFLHGRDIALELLLEQSNKVVRSDDPLKFALEQVHEVVDKFFTEGALSSKDNYIFIISFSAASDLKSQWSEYGDGHKGVSFALDLDNVRPPRGSGIAATFAPCLYTRREKEALAADALGHFIASVRKLAQFSSSAIEISGKRRDWELIQRAQGRPAIRDEDFLHDLRQAMEMEIREPVVRTAYDLIRIASHCKNDAFFEEREWRLALPVPKYRPNTKIVIKHRGSESSIPYIESDLLQRNGLLPITRVMLGPLCTRGEEVEALLASHGYNVPIEKSGIPLKSPNARP
jgi:hypothetical protein